MSLTMSHPHRLHRGRSYGQTSTASTVVQPARVGVIGLLTLLVGLWAAAVALVGPKVGYRATAATSWQWSTNNWALHLAPAAAGIVAGLMILGRSRSSAAPSGLVLWGLLAAAAGAWFVIGPALWPWLTSTATYGPATAARPAFFNQLGANLAPGVVLAVLSGMALKAYAASRAVLTNTAATPPAVQQIDQPAPGPVVQNPAL